MIGQLAGSVLRVATPAAPGRLLNGRYRLTQELARGGMAVVWVADDTLLARRVAVKTLLPGIAADPLVRVRFRNEAISAAALAHPGIVSTYDTGEDDGVAYIVMELIQGPNLRTVLERGPLPVPEAVRIAGRGRDALGHAHHHGVVHRDVKPANVLVPTDGPVKVTDFGIAKVAGSGDLTSTGSIIGTARYLAPEQVLGEPADGRADVYAVGLLLFQMLTGSLPFHGDTEMATALARVNRAPAPLPDQIPAGVAAVVDRCLEREPDRRYPSAEALATALDGIARGGDAARPTVPARPARDATLVAAAPAARTAPTRRAAPRRRNRFLWLWAVLGAGLLAVGAGAGYFAVTRASDDAGSNGGPVAPVVAADDFDPAGDNQAENPELAPFTIDGDPDTAWRTEHYNTADLGGKPGVGLVLTLQASSDISSVGVDTDGSGWSAQIYVAAAPASTLGGWGAPATSGDDLPTSHTFDLAPAASRPRRPRLVHTPSRLGTARGGGGARWMTSTTIRSPPRRPPEIGAPSRCCSNVTPTESSRCVGESSCITKTPSTPRKRPSSPSLAAFRASTAARRSPPGCTGWPRTQRSTSSGVGGDVPIPSRCCPTRRPRRPASRTRSTLVSTSTRRSVASRRSSGSRSSCETCSISTTPRLPRSSTSRPEPCGRGSLAAVDRSAPFSGTTPRVTNVQVRDHERRHDARRRPARRRDPQRSSPSSPSTRSTDDGWSATPSTTPTSRVPPRSRFVAAVSVAAAILIGVLAGVILVDRPDPPPTTAAAPEKAADDATAGEAVNPSAPAGAAERSVGGAFTPLGDVSDVTGDDQLRARVEAMLLRGGEAAASATTAQYACTDRPPDEFGLVAITAAATGTLEGEPVTILVGTTRPDGSVLAVAVRPATCEILRSVPLSVG